MLRVWVGPVYAERTMSLLRILVLANILRVVTQPYCSMLVAVGSQKVAVASALSEAVVNLVASIYLARHIGAIGVAYGTLIRSVICFGMNLVVNVRYSSSRIAISRMRYLMTGVLRPAVIAIPSLLLAPYWLSSPVPRLSVPAGLAWGLTTLLVALLVGLNAEERGTIMRLLERKMSLRASYN